MLRSSGAAGVSLYGDWHKAASVFRKVGNVALVKQKLDKAIHDFAEETLVDIKEFILSQPGEWQPLSEYTIKKKGSNMMLIETGQYLESLRVDKIADFEYFVGAIAGDMHFPSGLDMAVLGDWLEHGNKRIPARPHFRPIAIRKQREFRKTFSAEAIRNMIFEGIL